MFIYIIDYHFQTFEKNELIRCLTYVFDEKDVEEEIDGVMTKKTVDDIKLFVGTD